MLYKLPDNVVANIKAFLSRTNLSGAEVPLFNEILACFDNPVQTEVGSTGKDRK